MIDSAWLSRRRPWVIAHRGASRLAPENTLSAFRLAFELGADAVELDTKLTADGRVVVHHDLVLGRTNNGSGPLAARGLAELQRLDAGQWFGDGFAGERIPTLEEVFEAIGPDGLVNIEVANYGSIFDRLPEKVAELVRRYGWQRRIVISSWSPVALTKLRRLLPGVPLGVLVGPNRPRWEQILVPWLAPYDFVHAQERFALAVGGTPTVRWERPLVAWTVNEPVTIEQLARRRIHGIISDVPDVVRGIVDGHFTSG